MDPRRMFRESVEMGRDAMLASRPSGGQLSDEEALRRYITEHRGNPSAMLSFARSNAAGDPWRAAAEYEQRMEAMLRGGG